MIQTIRGLWVRCHLPFRTAATFTNLMQQPTPKDSASFLSKNFVEMPMRLPPTLLAEKKDGDPPSKKEEKTEKEKDKKKRQAKKNKKEDDDNDHKGGGLLQPIFEELEEMVKRRMPKPQNLI